MADLLDRRRRTAMCMQSTPTATLDLSVMISGPVTMLMWSVVSWATQEETPTRIPTGALFKVTLPWKRCPAGGMRSTSKSVRTGLQMTAAAARELECIVTAPEFF